MYIIKEQWNHYHWKIVARRYPHYAVIIVASIAKDHEGNMREWAAYMGAQPDAYRDEDLNWADVALQGSKQREEVARAYFPHLDDLPYRH